jgi:hypothetical protein
VEGAAMTVITFPKAYRKPLPPDAIPAGRERHAIVFPYNGKWSFMEMDEGGGNLIGGLTKRQAIISAVELVLDYCGTLEVRNTPMDECGGAA